jgi:hypothetical protein
MTMTLKGVIFIVIVISTATAFAQDEENEARFARIYEKFNKSEIGDQKWSEIVGDKGSENYTLENGDNLWDISAKLFGNGFYWPKVWQLNDNITNPHMIEPGKVLRFNPGSESRPPSLDVATYADSTESMTSETEEPEFDTITTLDSPEGQQIVIPPGRKSRPVLTHIPPSFPDTSSPVGKYDAAGFAVDGLKVAEKKIIAGPVPSIVVERSWDADGKVIEMEGDTTVASTYQNVIVKLKNKVNLGDYVTVFSTNGKITDPTTDNTIGVELETRAELAIIESMSADDNIYRATVAYTALPVRLNDSVKLGRLITRTTYERTGEEVSVAARIINGETNNRKVFGLHNVVYLDKGNADGLKVGSLLPIIKNVETRNPDTVIKFDSKPIGELKVVEVEAHVATAVIINEQDAVRPGDMTALIEEKSGEKPDSGDEQKPEDNGLQGE